MKQSCDGRVECVLNQQCVDAKLYLKTVFACIQSGLLSSGSDPLSPAPASDNNMKRGETENSRQREERVRTVMESNEARSANDSFSVTRTTNNISADITSTGKPHSWTHWKSLSDEINLDILPLEQNLQLPASPGQHSSRGLSDAGGWIWSD